MGVEADADDRAQLGTSCSGSESFNAHASQVGSATLNDRNSEHLGLETSCIHSRPTENFVSSTAQPISRPLSDADNKTGSVRISRGGTRPPEHRPRRKSWAAFMDPLGATSEFPRRNSLSPNSLPLDAMQLQNCKNSLSSEKHPAEGNSAVTHVRPRRTSLSSNADADGESVRKLGLTELLRHNLRASFRAMSNTQGQIADSEPSHGSLPTLPGQSAWVKVRSLLRSGQLARTEQAAARRLGRVRMVGWPPDNPLRDVQRQRELFTPHRDSPRSDWRRRGEVAQENPDLVQEIVEKAQRYSGRKTLRHDAPKERIQHGLKIAAPYVKVAAFVVLATLDIVLALVFQIFWSDSDFLCEDDAAERPILVLLSTVAGLHFLRTVSWMLKTDGGGELIGLRYFYSRELFGYVGVWSNNLDISLNAVSILMLVFHALDCDDTMDLRYSLVVRRMHRHCHLIRGLFAIQRCFSMNEYLRQQLQVAVSVNRRRFVSAETNTNLDLTYICDRLIAMAIPCVTSMYRNNIRDVARFFGAFHYGQFLVYNVCEGHDENGNGNYDTSVLYNQVQHVTFPHGNAPYFRCLVEFCETATEWLRADDKNVVVVQGLEGVGRTGTLCAGLMLYHGFCDSAQEALDKFALRRTQRTQGHNAVQGVSSPSQIRYVHYLEAHIYTGIDFRGCEFRVMQEISMGNVSPACMKGCSLSFVVQVDGKIHYDHGKEAGFLGYEACEKQGFVFSIGNVVVAGDVSVRFFLFDEADVQAFTANHSQVRGELGDCAKTIKYGPMTEREFCFVTFHTVFHQGDITFSKKEVDGACNLHEDKLSDDFWMTMSVRDLQALESQEAAHDTPQCTSYNTSASSVPRTMPLLLNGVEEFLPRQLNCAKQILSMRKVVKATFERLCPKAVSFSSEESILQHRSTGHFILHYIVKGTASTVPKSLVTSVRSINASFDGDCHGRGHVLHEGLEDILVGTPPVYYACREGAATRCLEIPLSPDGYLPMAAPGMDEQELASLYSYLACQESTQTRRYRDKNSALQKRHQTLRTTLLLGSRSNKKLLHQLVQRFGIASSETLFGASNVGVQDGRGHFDAGRVYVVSSWVLVSTNRSILNGMQSRELVIRIQDIQTAQATGSLLTLSMDGNGEVETHLSCSSESNESLTSDHKRAGGWQAARQPAVAKKRQAGLMQRRCRSGAVLLRCANEQASEALCKAVHERILELRASRLKQYSCDMSALKFGYILPREPDDGGAQAFLQHLLNISEVRTFAAGEEIIDKQSSARRLYHVISGTCVRYSNNDLSMEHIGPGEMFGEWRFLSNNSGVCENSKVVASSEAKCFVSPFEQVQTLCSLRTEFAVRFYRGLALSCIIRNRQFRHMYQTNLQLKSESDKADHIRLYDGQHGKHSPKHSTARSDNSTPRAPLVLSQVPNGTRASGRFLRASAAHVISRLRSHNGPPDPPAQDSPV